jgi:hypothetical protein
MVIIPAGTVAGSFTVIPFRNVTAWRFDAVFHPVTGIMFVFIRLGPAMLI